LSDEDARQLQNEARQYTEEAQRLRGQLRPEDLRGSDIDPKELDRVIGALHDLQDPRIYKNPAELSKRQAYVAEGLKRVEFALRRQVDQNNAVAISGADEVPDQFRDEVAEYYRSLAKTPQK
jgi:hypothetical protein